MKFLQRFSRNFSEITWDCLTRIKDGHLKRLFKNFSVEYLSANEINDGLGQQSSIVFSIGPFKSIVELTRSRNFRPSLLTPIEPSYIPTSSSMKSVILNATKDACSEVLKYQIKCFIMIFIKYRKITLLRKKRKFIEVSKRDCWKFFQYFRMSQWKIL